MRVNSNQFLYICCELRLFRENDVFLDFGLSMVFLLYCRIWNLDDVSKVDRIVCVCSVTRCGIYEAFVWSGLNKIC